MKEEIKELLNTKLLKIVFDKTNSINDKIDIIRNILIKFDEKVFNEQCFPIECPKAEVIEEEIYRLYSIWESYEKMYFLPSLLDTIWKYIEKDNTKNILNSYLKKKKKFNFSIKT